VPPLGAADQERPTNGVPAILGEFQEIPFRLTPDEPLPTVKK
jgi:hypothetical protein